MLQTHNFPEAIGRISKETCKSAGSRRQVVIAAKLPPRKVVAPDLQIHQKHIVHPSG
jgi:hypothetical protein